MEESRPPSQSKKHFCHPRFFVCPVIQPQLLPRISSGGSKSLWIAYDHNWKLFLAGVVAAQKKLESRFFLFQPFERRATQCPPRILPKKKAKLVRVPYAFLVIVKSDLFQLRQRAIDCFRIGTAFLSVILRHRKLNRYSKRANHPLEKFNINFSSGPSSLFASDCRHWPYIRTNIPESAIFFAFWPHIHAYSSSRELGLLKDVSSLCRFFG